MFNIDNQNLILIGFMGSGKTTVGTMLSNRLNKAFIDTDKLIEQRLNLSIPEIFNKYGEEYFRNIESEEIKGLLNISNSVISTGGGAFCSKKNIDLLKSIGKTFYLKTSENYLLKRFTEEEIKKRPLLQNIDNFKKLLQSREQFYQQAEIHILTDNKSPETIAELIENNSML